MCKVNKYILVQDTRARASAWIVLNCRVLGVQIRRVALGGLQLPLLVPVRVHVHVRVTRLLNNNLIYEP